MDCHKRFTLLAGWVIIASLLLATCGPAATLTPAAASTPLAAARVPPTNTPRPAAGGPIGDLTITILYDNTAHDARLQSDWGFAALIQYGDHTLLFDTANSGQMLVSNMDKLGAGRPANLADSLHRRGCHRHIRRRVRRRLRPGRRGSCHQGSAEGEMK